MNYKFKPMTFNIEELKEKAKNGDGFACYIVARSYDSGENGVEQDLKEAFYWYHQGTLLGDPKCMYGVGACYYFGDYVQKNEEYAKIMFVAAYPKLLKEVDEIDDLKKQSFTKFCLGAYYYFGFGEVAKDDKMAFILIAEAARQGHIAAIYDLGANFYYNGVGTSKNLELSKYFLTVAADAGLPRAIKKLEEYQDTYNKHIK